VNVKHFVSKAFPIPKSLVLSNVAISIFDSQLSFFEIKKSRGHLYPKAWGTIPFPRISLSKIDDKSMVEAAHTLQGFSKAHGYSFVHALIHEGEAYVFRLVVPTINRSELRGAIESVLEENVPIPPAEAVLEFTIVKEDYMRGETTVAVSVVNQQTVSAYSEMLSMAGLTPISFETEARALARALFSKEATDVSLVLAIKPNHTIVTVTEGRAVVFSSSIEIGSEDLNQAIAKTLDISLAEAKAMKDQGVTNDESLEDKIFRAGLPVFSSIHDEIGKVLVFWKAQEKKIKDFKDVSKIVLAGSDSLMPCFSRYISMSFKLPTEVGSVWTNMFDANNCVPLISRKDSLDYGSDIGALLL
jgi:Tfp pilus assembly PilM family ATPase